MPRTTRIIRDIPAEKDEFGGKGHDRTANSLVDAINQMEGHDGAIGLEGTWGAGKSTVIRIAEKKLAARDRNDLKHAIFTFDLWAHQSDDFRRAFLESFVAWLAAQKILSTGTLDKAQDEIRDRVKSVTVESSKKYNAFGIVFILVLPLLPFIYAWLGPSALKPADGGVLQSDWPFYAKSILFLLYGSVGLRFLGLYFTVTWPYGRWPIGRSQRSFADAASSCVSMFSKDVESETTKQNIRETDPTTIEFHRIFRNLLNEAQSRGIAIIHVLDNIDRLPEGAVANAWSEIRALFAIRGGPTTNSHDNVLVVLPYDKKFVMEALGEEGVDKEADFIEKTFSRTMRVAPPISHDWKGFFLSKIEECFSEAGDNELNERLFRLLRYSFQKTNIHASPRRIIHFVNELGALDAQWQGSISLEACAVYILNRKKIEASSDSLRNDETIDLRYVQIANVEDIHKEIAALAFNVEPAAAYQVLLQGPISKALISPDVEELQKLSSAPGFNDVLQDVLQDPSREWLLTPKGVLVRVCMNLAGLQMDDARAKVCWRDVAGDIHRLNDSIYPDKEVIGGLSLAIQGVRDAKTATQLARKIQSILGGNQLEIDEVEPFDYGVAWFAATTIIQNSLRPLIPEDAFRQFKEKTGIPLSPEAIIGCAHQCGKAGEYLLWEVHKADAEPTSLEEALLACVDSNPSIAVGVLDQIDGYFSRSNDRSLLTALTKKLQTGALTAEDEQPKRTALLQLVQQLCFSIGGGVAEFWKDIVKPLTLDGSLAFHAYNAQQAGDKPGAAKAVAILMSLQVSAKPYVVPGDHPQLGNAAVVAVNWFNSLSSDGIDDDEFVELIAKASQELSMFGEWLDRGLQDAVSAVLHAQVLRMIIQHLNMRKLNVPKVVTAYPRLKQFIDDDSAMIAFLKNLSRWSFDEVLKDREKLLALPSDLISDAHAHVAAELSKLLEAVDRHITSASQVEWEEALTEENDLLRLYILRHRDSTLYPPVNILRPALFGHIVALLKGDVKINLPKADWDIVVDGLGAHNKGTLAADVLIAVTTMVVDDDGLLEFIEYYSQIAGRMEYIEYPDVSLNRIFSKLIVSNNLFAQAFSDENLDIIDNLLETASEQSKGAFLETIRSQSVSEGVEGERLEALRKRFGIVDEASATAVDENSSDQNESAES